MKPFTICVATEEHLGYAKDVSEALADAAKASGTGLAILLFALPQVEIQEGLMDKPLYQSSFCVEEVNRRVREGAAFRDAYRAVGEEVAAGTFRFEGSLHHTHEGSLGNLCNEQIAKRFQTIVSAFEN
jgi:argininosuccinate lyase